MRMDIKIKIICVIESKTRKDELMKKTIIMLLSMLIIWVVNAQAGNFGSMQDALKKAGFQYKGVANDFLIYEKPKIKFLVRNCNGFLCEGFIVADTVSDEILAENLILLYGGLQNTFLNHPNSKVEWVEPGSWRRRVFVLIEQVLTNLKQSNKTEFAFDHLNVRGQCIPVSEEDYRAGHRPVLTIKLWMP